MKYALVTGSTKGIGLSISGKLIENDYFVYMNYAHDDEAALAVELDPDKYRIIKADLSTQTGAKSLIESIRCDKISFNCVIFNAGVPCRKPFMELSYEDINEVMNINVSVPFLICQQLYPNITENGSIIFIGSDMGIHPHSTSPIYSVAKAAVHMLARSLVKEYAERCIRVNALAPGFIETQWHKNKPEWLRENIENKIALNRFGAPNEVADACMFLVENNFVNGAVLQVDGGYNYE